ncbi:hypothetical protein ASG39_08610 [Rhizobium sp. Leaf371]|uniref:hypothetical protein n=1 Tax=unclassified Rhizobium TaxID=2613769 RepID=UPI0007129744|nr:MULTISPECIES: hypothetical protein [unclassified Rhizobium]KQS65300.1 hypothetical protein ASG39_08610 [Rhizobium sp. Leaf371]TCM56268.1 hypothetical protein C8J36_103644 [Rhizobium sp. PP-F2F-G48]
MSLNSSNEDVRALRDEVARLTKIVSSQGARAYSDTRDKAAEAYEAAAPYAKKAVSQVKAEGRAVADVAREHPTGIASVVVLATAIGVAVGYILGSSSEPEPRSWWR